MINHTNSLLISDSLRETSRAEDGEFPFTAIESDLARYPGCTSDWHWHAPVELGWIVEGSALCATQRQSFRIEAGQGYFINADVLHMHRTTEGTERALLRVLQFDPGLVGGLGRAARKYVQPVLKNGLDALPLTGDDPAQRVILEAAAGVFHAAEAEEDGFEMTVACRLTEAWQGIYRLAGQTCDASEPILRTDVTRTKAMLAFIHGHYAEPIGVEDVAASAGISAREAHRTFRQVLGVTPVAYLTRHRVEVAARMLSEADSTVTEAAMACGFSTPSYFCKVFRAAIGVPPSDYRKNGGRT